MMAVPITLEPTFRAGTAKPLFEGDYIFYREGRHYDVSADGERFLMIRAGSGKDESALGEGQLVYVENWFTELERLVPAGEP